MYDERGSIVAQSTEPVATRRSPPARVEHDAAELLGSVRRCVAAVARALGPDVTALRGAAMATQRSTLACAARGGEPLTPLISWQDRRGGEDLDRYARDAATIKRITGLRLSPHYGIGKLRWCLRHDARARAHFAHHDLMAAPLASLLVHTLCRERAWLIDPVNASRTLLMDLGSASWSETLLSLFEVPVEILPTILPNRSSFGTVAVGEHLTPLTVLTGDQAAALFASGDPAPGTAFINIGTGAFIQVATGARPIDDAALLTSVVWQDEHGLRYVLEGTVNGAASAVDAVSGALGIEVSPGSPELAHALDRIEQSPLYLNGTAGLGSPDWAPAFTSRFIGDGDALARLAAVYESIAFLIQRNLDRLSERVPLTGVRVSGGMARLDWLVQRIADLSGLTVARPADTEATLAGLAYLASSGAVVCSDAGTEFRARPNAVAARRYEEWTRALNADLAH